MAAVTQVTQQDLRKQFEELKRQQEAQFSTLFDQIQQLLKDNTDTQDNSLQSHSNQQQFNPGRQPYRERDECWYCKKRRHQVSYDHFNSAVQYMKHFIYHFTKRRHLQRDCSLWKQKQGNERKATSNTQRSA